MDPTTPKGMAGTTTDAHSKAVDYLRIPNAPMISR